MSMGRAALAGWKSPFSPGLKWEKNQQTKQLPFGQKSFAKNHLNLCDDAIWLLHPELSHHLIE